MMRCVQCDTELVAPVRSEYWSDKHACHVWLLPEMLRLFFVYGLLSCRHRHGLNEGYPDRRPVTVSIAAGRIVREFRMCRQDAAMLLRFAQ
jgi:hypothetical protein